MKKPFVFSQQFKHAAGLGATFYKAGNSQEPIYLIAYSPNLALTRGMSDFSITIGSHLTYEAMAVIFGCAADKDIDGMLRELAFTGRTFGGEEACSMGLVNRTYSDHAALLAGVMALAREIAAKSPVAVRGTKEMLRYMRDHRIDDGLEYVATWNASMLQSEDLRIAIAAHMSKQKPEFSN